MRSTSLSITRRVAALALALATTVGANWIVIAQASRTVADGVYTTVQAQRGQALYTTECRACHGVTLEGGLGPPLTGASFLQIWNGRSIADLVDKIEHTMPATKPGTLSRLQAADLVAHILQIGGFKAGAAELPASAALTGIAIRVAAVVTAASAPANPAAAGPPPATLPPGNMAQVMRGILFPSSNLLFNVQNQDPGEQKVGWSPGGPTAFSWVDWGAGIYSGWELVDYAAIALAESTPLLLTPGRRCENGKPVPVERADWVRQRDAVLALGQ